MRAFLFIFILGICSSSGYSASKQKKTGPTNLTKSIFVHVKSDADIAADKEALYIRDQLFILMKKATVLGNSVATSEHIFLDDLERFLVDGNKLAELYFPILEYSKKLSLEAKVIKKRLSNAGVLAKELEAFESVLDRVGWSYAKLSQYASSQPIEDEMDEENFEELLRRNQKVLFENDFKFEEWMDWLGFDSDLVDFNLNKIKVRSVKIAATFDRSRVEKDFIRYPEFIYLLTNIATHFVTICYQLGWIHLGKPIADNETSIMDIEYSEMLKAVYEKFRSVQDASYKACTEPTSTKAIYSIFRTNPDFSKDQIELLEPEKDKKKRKKRKKGPKPATRVEQEDRIPSPRTPQKTSLVRYFIGDRTFKLLPFGSYQPGAMDFLQEISKAPRVVDQFASVDWSGFHNVPYVDKLLTTKWRENMYKEADGSFTVKSWGIAYFPERDFRGKIHFNTLDEGVFALGFKRETQNEFEVYHRGFQFKDSLTKRYYEKLPAMDNEFRNAVLRDIAKLKAEVRSNDARNREEKFAQFNAFLELHHSSVTARFPDLVGIIKTCPEYGFMLVRVKAGMGDFYLYLPFDSENIDSTAFTPIKFTPDSKQSPPTEEKKGRNKSSAGAKKSLVFK